MTKTRRLIVTATAGVVGVLIAGGAAVAVAGGSGTPTTLPAAATRYNQGGFTADGEGGPAAPGGQSADGQDPGGQGVEGQGGEGQGTGGPGAGQSMNGGQGMPGRGDLTEVTGDELTSVTAAVIAHDSGITVEGVLKDGDGNYDVRGTKDGKPIMLRVSSDLATVTEASTGQSGARGGPTPTGGGAGGAAGGGAGAGTPPDQSGGQADATTQTSTATSGSTFTLST